MKPAKISISLPELQQHIDENYVGIKLAAKILAMTPFCVREAVAQGKLQVLKIRIYQSKKTFWMIPKADLIAYRPKSYGRFRRGKQEAA